MIPVSFSSTELLQSSQVYSCISYLLPKISSSFSSSFVSPPKHTMHAPGGHICIQLATGDMLLNPT